MTYHSDTKAVLLAEILPTLKKYGISLKAEKRANIEDLVPDYAKDYLYARVLYLDTAIAILCGINPNNPEYDGGGEWKDGSNVPEYNKFYGIFEDGIAKNEITPTLFSPPNANQLEHDDIRQFCASKGIYWPIPSKNDFVKPIFSTKENRDFENKISDLEAKLNSATMQLKEHEANTKFMREVTQERDSLRENLGSVMAENKSLIEQLNDITRQNTILEADLINGKSRTFFLEMLGGLVTSILYVDIFKSGNISVGKVTMALEIVGLTPTPETVSQYLKAAASKLEENNKDTAIKEYLAKFKQTENS